MTRLFVPLLFALAFGFSGCRAEGVPAPVEAALEATSSARWGDLRMHEVLREGAGEPTDLVVVLLHGWGARGDGLVELARGLRVPPGTRFLVPEAPLERPEGGRAWWHLDPDRFRDVPPGGRDLSRERPEGLAAARAAVSAVIEEARERGGLPPERVVIGGFSQGAMLATDVALHVEGGVGGLFILSGARLSMEEWGPRMREHAETPVFVSHGRYDPVLPHAGARLLADELVAAGHPVEFVDFMGRHAIPRSVRRELGAFLTRLARRSGR